jgi:hypothetical protein
MVQEKAQMAAPMDPSASVASVASASKVGELFEYTVGNVSLPRQRSAMIPIVTDAIDVQRLSIYNQSVMPRNPLNGALITNTTQKHLLAGPITVLDGGAYAGDARIDNVPPGQDRLISYGIDLQVLVDAGENKTDSALTGGKIVKGVLHLTRRDVSSTPYVVQNKSDKDKAVIIEHPLQAEWKLVSPPSGAPAGAFAGTPYETTDKFHRFKGIVPAGKSARLVVDEEKVLGETLAILNAEGAQLELYSTHGQLPEKVKTPILKAMQLKSVMVATQQRIAERQQQAAGITQEQKRIRENMQAVDKTAAYYGRLLAKLNDQETQLEKLQGEVEALHAEFAQQRTALEEYLNGLNVE